MKILEYLAVIVGCAFTISFSVLFYVGIFYGAYVIFGG